MGGAVSTGLDNDDLIDNLMSAQYIKTPEIERVFRAVDRAAYFLPEYQVNAYKDLAWKNGNIHISAPCIYSAVLENLKLEAGLSFLNIGSGTGYLSTMVGLILGPFGVNHGIEMHADVIKYAYEKLSDFKKNSPALDCFEFCDPVFVKGNGLCLPSEIRQYDRVYCGAACPVNHEYYVKSLIKVGGVLVMPQNDQLLQITRTSHLEWESKSVLPVSFSMLQLPNAVDSKSHISLPDTEPISLQAVCRSCIRRTLRSNAERDYPHLTKPRPKRTYPRKKRALRNLVIPFLESSDDEAEPGSGLRQPTLVVGTQARITAVFDMGLAWPLTVGRRRIIRTISPQPRQEVRENPPEPTPEEDLDAEENTNEESPENNENGESSNSSHRPKVPKREKFDSGVIDDIDNGKGLAFSDEENETHDRYQLTSDEETMEVESDSDFIEAQKSEDEGVEEDLPRPKKGSGCGAKRENDEPEFTYSSVMKAKIKCLPLPPMLKSYVNLNREF